MQQKQPQHFYTLDGARVIAALAILFWHWQHFFYEGTRAVAFAKQQQPLYAVFFPFYNHGLLAVDFFFTLSGFVFFWLYAAKIHQRTIPARDFFFRRLSKLYPLHLASLLLVTLAQMLVRVYHGTYFVYAHNDAYHFILNLLLIPAWGLEQGWSFNAPVWAVSVELFLYVSFFLLCRLRLDNVISLIILVMGGVVMRDTGANELLGRGLISFYLGGLAYYVYNVIRRRVMFRKAPWLVLAGLALLGLGLYLAGEPTFYTSPYRATDPIIALYLLLIVFLALLESWQGPIGKRFAALSAFTYPAYLLHFPLQIAFWSILERWGKTPAVFYQIPALLVYFALVGGCAWLAHRFFEKPVTRALRAWFQAKYT